MRIQQFILSNGYDNERYLKNNKMQKKYDDEIDLNQMTEVYILSIGSNYFTFRIMSLIPLDKNFTNYCVLSRWFYFTADWLFCH